ncbi:hypothetical protein DVH05_006777 [Phytophthora capsici]|nr:hypothetical protein DVH05_006777 [Phytophthora capsici]
MNAETAGIVNLPLSPTTLAQVQQPLPHGAADQVASVGAPAAPRSKSKRGRLSKSEQELWTLSSTETLFTVRYVTAKDNFSKARNHVEVRAAWILVATLVNKAEDTTYTVTQCKDKVKWLKRKWSMYREDRNTTGNVPKDTASPCLELMLEHWAPNPGMQNTTLLDGTSELDDAAMDNASSNEDQGRSSRKKNARNPTVNVWKKGFVHWLTGLKLSVRQ